MDIFFNVLRKTLVATITLVFAFVVIYTPQQFTKVPEAEAAWPTFETNPALVGSSVATAVQTTAAAVKEYGLDQIGFLLAKTMISNMLQSMITWINNGFKGSPAFIQDLDRFLLNVADEAAGEYIQGLGDIGSFICSPFRLDIQLALSLKYQRARERRDIDSCTLSGVVNNVEDFFDSQVARKDFWEQWIEVTSKPETYTPYGQFMAAEAELNARLVNAKGQEIQIANWGNGFLSNEICEAIEGPNGENERCVISTPGRVIADQINKALGAGQDQLVAADELNEVISALLGQIANQALVGAAGLLGLSVGTGYTAGGYGSGSYVDELATQANSNAANFLGQNYDAIIDKLDVQKDYNALAVEYIPKLRAVIDALDTAPIFRGLSTQEIADLKARARIAYDDALEVRQMTTAHIAFLEPLVASYDSLQRELVAPNTSEERKRAIAIEQSQIISKAAGYSAYTIYRLRESSREWADITS